ncbi:4-alpha-glucanotransferase [Christensenellaceae bacterium OttesenSCG-928-K19]|nr:4-alpha-glucanotransferase [Christensenellaceae bacterium OttesenSCG-928-K19]
MKRSAGVLMHITSLPSPYGIGTMGKAAFEYVDFLKACGQGYWQILPLNPTGFGDSPYQCFSTFAGNPYLIDLDLLREQGLLKKKEYEGLDWGSDPESVDYGKVYNNKFKVLAVAAGRARLIENKKYNKFCRKNEWWLHDYARYMAIKGRNGMRSWMEWEDEGLRLHKADKVEAYAEKHEEDVHFWMYIQFLFFEQWGKLKRYANEKGVKIIGDIPIYVAPDSADVWAGRKNFLFDDDHSFSCYAGVPPDYFCEDGQFWGNPIYNWDHMKKNNYDWWIKRLVHLESLYDMIRIDHFRGFQSYYSIDRNETTARNGQWREGPCMDFFGEVKKQLKDFPIIAEDLGFLTPEVHAMRQKTGYPGMKVLQFAFDPKGESDYLPHKYEKNCVVYTGTHDNTTLAGWLDEAGKDELRFAARYGAFTKKEGYCWGMLRLMHSSVANLAIAQMQDYLELSADARMNTPATFGKNWRWRVKPGYAKPALAKRIRRMVRLYGR